MSSFHAHVRARLLALLDPPRPGPSGPWALSKVSKRVLGKEPRYLSRVLADSPDAPPLLVRHASAIVETKKLGAGVLLDGEETRQTFADLVYSRVLGLLSVAGVTPTELLKPPAVSTNANRVNWSRSRKLSCDEVDRVLERLGLPLGAMFAPALGPYDARLLAFLAGRQDETGARATRAEVQALLAGYRGAPMPSRPIGSRAGGAQLSMSGCSGAVRRMIDQDLLEVAEAGATPLSDVLRVTGSGRRASRPNPNPGT